MDWVRHLAYFLAIAEEGHVGDAADRLGIAQPALSQRLRRLEAELDARLFDRTSRGMVLTPAGEALRAEASGLLARFAAMRTEVARAARGDAGTLRLGVPAQAPGGALAAALAALGRSHPALRVELHDASTPRQRVQLADGRLHAGLALALAAPAPTPRAGAVAGPAIGAAAVPESGGGPPAASGSPGGGSGPVGRFGPRSAPGERDPGRNAGSGSGSGGGAAVGAPGFAAGPGSGVGDEALAGAGDGAGLVVGPVVDVPLGVVVARTSPLAAHTELALADLAGEGAVLPADDPDLRDATLAACRAGGWVPARVREAAQHEVVLALVAAGEGVAFDSGAIARKEPRVAWRPLAGPVLAWRMAVVWPDGGSHPAVPAVASAVAEALAEAAQPGWPGDPAQPGGSEGGGGEASRRSRHGPWAVVNAGFDAGLHGRLSDAAP